MGKEVDLRVLDYKRDTETQSDTVTLYRRSGAQPCCFYRDPALDDALTMGSRVARLAPQYHQFASCMPVYPLQLYRLRSQLRFTCEANVVNPYNAYTYNTE